MSEGWRIQGAVGTTLFECDGIMEMSRKLVELKHEIRINKTTEELLVLFKEAVQDKYTWSLEKEVKSKPAKKTKGKKRPSTNNKPAGDRLHFLLVPFFPPCVSFVFLPSLPSHFCPPPPYPLSLYLYLILLSLPACLPECVQYFFILTASYLLFASFVFIQNSF
jgi:hypothetical protein